jgi:hypothetical protein
MAWRLHVDADHFDSLTRLVSTVGASRRHLAVAVAGLVSFSALPAQTRPLKRKPLQFNKFGCVNVGNPCRGRNGVCCSGICQGRAPKKGQKDRSRCVAHDTGGCTLNDNFCAGGEDNRCATGCICNNTTGKAPHCGGSSFCPSVECKKDADCGEPGAACIPPINCQGCGSPATKNFCQRPCHG